MTRALEEEEPGERKSPLRGLTTQPPTPGGPGAGEERPGSAPGGGAETGVGEGPGNNGTFIWDCWFLSGWAEEEDADRAEGEGTGRSIWLHTCSYLTLCVLSARLAGGQANRRSG